MKYLSMMSVDDIILVCENFPQGELQKGFKQYSKDFNIIMPGHRPQAVSTDRGRKLLADNPKSVLTTKMVRSLVDSWMNGVTSAVKKQMDAGMTKEEAIISTMPNSAMPDMVELYLRLSEEAYDQNYINALNAAIKINSYKKKNDRLVTSTESIDRINSDLKKLRSDIKKKQSQIKSLSKDSENLKKNNEFLMESLKEKDTTIIELNQSVKDLERKEKECTNTISQLKRRIALLDKDKDQLQNDIINSDKKVVQLDEVIRELNSINESMANELNSLKKEIQSASNNAYLLENNIYEPESYDEFEEYLGYNLMSAGLSDSMDYWNPMISFIERFLFSGKPFICNTQIGNVLARCISNTLYGTTKVKIIPYSDTISSEEIRKCLRTDEKILILEDFLGNYNDIELLSIIRRYPGKKLFLTIEYDKTIAYLPEEIFGYCRYVNFNNISEFFLINEIDEDPSEIREVPSKNEDKHIDKRTQKLFTEIARQLGFSEFFINSNLRDFENEDTMALSLLFSIIPLSVELLEANPFEVSRRLRGYAGSEGSCRYKEIINRWYNNE